MTALKILVAIAYLFAVGSLALGITALMLGVIPAPIAAENDAENSYYGHFEWLKNNRAEAVGWMEKVVKMGAVTAEGYDFYKHIEAAEFQQAKEHIEDFAADIYNYVVFKLAAEINPAPTAEQLQQLRDTCFNGYETVDEIRAAVTEILSK